MWEERRIPVRTNWNWRNAKEREGFVVGECEFITKNALAEEYVPVRFKEGLQLIHKSKLIRK